MLDESSLPWPQKGDKLFMTGEDWYHNACLNFAPDSFGLYIMGYKEAGDRLVLSVMEGHSHLDFLVYPIVFLYRQYLELNLKYLVREGNRLLDVTPKSKTGFSGGHDLSFLWKECSAVLSQVGSHYPELQISNHDLKIVGQLLTDFSQVDPGSDAFRYPVDRDNIPSIPSLRTVNVRHLAEIMDKVASFLGSASDAISACSDLKREYVLDLQREVEQYNDPPGQPTEFD
jgi:hypothetical protein